MIIVNPQACSENEHLYVKCVALGKWWGSGKWLMTTSRVAASLLTPLGADEMIRDHHCFNIFFMGMKQRAMFIVSMFCPLWKGFVCDPLWNMAVARGLVNPHTVKKKHDARNRRRGSGHGERNSGLCQSALAFYPEWGSRSKGPYPHPVSLPWGMCSSSTRLDFSNPVAAPPAPQAWSEEAVTKVRKQTPGRI